MSQEDAIVNVKILAPPFSHITVGSSPTDGMTLETARKYDIFLNFCETISYMDPIIPKPREGQHYVWSPVPEVEFWGYKAFFDAKKTLDSGTYLGQNIYVHCASGTNRSPLITLSWLASLGYSIEDASLIVANNNESLAKSLLNKLMMNVTNNHIPSDLDSFYHLYDHHQGNLSDNIMKIMGDTYKKYYPPVN